MRKYDKVSCDPLPNCKLLNLQQKTSYHHPPVKFLSVRKQRLAFIQAVQVPQTLGDIWTYYVFRIANSNVMTCDNVCKFKNKLRYTFRQRSLAWPVHRKVRPRHPVFPPVWRNEIKRYTPAHYDFWLIGAKFEGSFFLSCVSNVVFKQWHLRFSLQSALTSRGPSVLRAPPHCPNLFMHR